MGAIYEMEAWADYFANLLNRHAIEVVPSMVESDNEIKFANKYLKNRQAARTDPK